MSERLMKIWECFNNIDCGASVAVRVDRDRVVVEVEGGCWGSWPATVIVTKDKIIVEDMEGKRHELPTPWDN